MLEEVHMQKCLSVMQELAVKAGHEIMRVYFQKELFEQVEYKSDNSPLTRADRLSNEIIVEGLKKEFPTYAILSEEEKDNLERLKNDHCFIVDPLDGTKEFLKRNGQFTVNIALAYRQRAVTGVIYVPAAEELYYGAKGCGSFLRTPDGKVRRLHVSDMEEIARVRLVMSSSHGCEEMDRLIEKYHIAQERLVKMGSSLKGCLVARGDAEIYYRYNPTMEWDTAAMQCIVEEAGGIFRQMDDTEMLYNRENSLNEKGFYVINSEKNRIR